MVPWLKDLQEQSLLVLNPAGNDQVAPSIFSVLFGIIIHKLQCVVTYAVAQACSSQVVVGVNVVWLHLLHVAYGINEGVRRIHGDGHCAPIVADEKAKSTPLAGVIVRHLEVDLYIGNKV